MIKIKDKKVISDFIMMLKESVSPFHNIKYISNILQKNNYEKLDSKAIWNINEGKNYYIPLFDSSLIAFSIGENLNKNLNLRLAAGHTDWPCLKLKPNPELKSEKYGKLNIEVYGGPILNTWLDRPLGLSGKVCIVSDNPFEPTTKYINIDTPIAIIPNVAIHMNRDVNKGVELNPQIDMLPICEILQDSLLEDNFLLKVVADNMNCNIEDILDYELILYNLDDPMIIGTKNQFLRSPRLDNISAIHAATQALLESNNCVKDNQINMILLYDNEEIGSNTKQGALSSITERMIEKLCYSLGYTRAEFLNILTNAFLLSIDGAHAIHPNHPEKCDIKNKISLGDGLAIKLSASQAYATDAKDSSIIEAICRNESIPYKKFSNRSDLRGGSSLGSLASTNLGIRTVDIGIPTLAMHSSRELVSIDDQIALCNLTKSFFKI